ncbi:MAG: hypothetical protein J6U08_04300 [Paludibacteraceae bacterium]|nr:hypothetical protein [Paludibacteraceae bacterium]
MSELLFTIIIVLLALCILPLIGTVLTCHVISKIKGLECLKRKGGIVFMILFNSQVIYFINVDIVEGWFGIQNSFFDDEAVIEASTPYGKFSTVNEQPVYSFFRYDDDRPWFSSGGIDSIAEYDQYIVMAADSSYLLIDQRVKGEKAIKILSLTDLPVDVQQMSFASAPKYIKDLYWRIHHDNHLYVIKVLLALALSALVTALGYFLFKKIWSKIRRGS